MSLVGEFSEAALLKLGRRMLELLRRTPELLRCRPELLRCRSGPPECVIMRIWVHHELLHNQENLQLQWRLEITQTVDQHRVLNTCVTACRYAGFRCCLHIISSRSNVVL